MIELKLSPEKMDRTIVGGQDGDSGLVGGGQAFSSWNNTLSNDSSSGVILDPVLLLDSKPTIVAWSVSYHIWLMCCLCPLLEDKGLAVVVCALLTSR